ncbi:hypothetical protein JTE90_002360 [Oedothorax gibbosus]|uniref:THAP-type domain-containing protein n=1 Tax=Oedothorax gibbosus TaxID=931172 RepID=A0AAV6UK24_9ARAC|nr:hypothetical protein JTE90_002360 [Oedothorax gibbosus]
MPPRSKCKDRSCYVPEGTTNYKSSKKNGEKFTLFGAPVNDELRAKWARKIPRSDRVFDVKSCVCEKHFDEQFISREYVHKINGEEVRIPRHRPVLADDTIPTIFPNLPKYFSSVPKKRKIPKRVAQPPLAKKRKVEYQINIDELKDINLPSHWSKIIFKGNVTTIGYALYSEESIKDLKPNKFVLIKQEKDKLYYSTTVNDVPLKSNILPDSVSTLTNVLRDLDTFLDCMGAGDVHEFGEAIGS